MLQKVLIVSCDGLENGGVQNIFMNIVRFMHPLYHFDIIVFNKNNSYFCKEFEKYGKIFKIPHYKGSSLLRKKIDFYIRFFRIYKGTKKILKENGPYEVIHCHNYFEAAPCLIAAKKCGVSVRISHSHNSFPKSHIFIETYRKIYRFFINRYATHKIGCSQAAVDYLFGKNRGISIPNAINLAKFDISKYHKKKVNHSFIHVARICNEKNQSFILDIFFYIQHLWTNASLKFVSDQKEPEIQKLKEKIKRLSLKNILFLPHNSNVPNLMAESEYMIFPSIFEGFGLVLVEAQAMNVKCFASDVIPRESNIGLCKYLSLNQSAQYWANEIFKTEKEPIKKTDISKVDLSNYLKKIKNIYEEIK